MINDHRHNATVNNDNTINDDQFVRLSKTRLVSRSLNLGGDGCGAPAVQGPVSPRLFLIKTMLKTPVPLWMPSCKARTSSHNLTAQYTEYFDLRCQLLQVGRITIMMIVMMMMIMMMCRTWSRKIRRYCATPPEATSP